MNKAMFTVVLCAILAAGVGAQTRLGECKRENVTGICAMSDNTLVVCYRKQEEGLIVTNKYYVDIGNKTECPYDIAENLRLSPEGKVLAYDAKIDEKPYLIVDGNKFGPYQFVDQLTFSSDSKTFAFVAEIEGNLYVVFENKKYGPYREVHSLTFAPDGKNLAYIVENGPSRFAVIAGGAVLGPYHGIVGSLRFSPDNNALSFLAYKDSKYYVITDGVAEGPYIDAVYSPDGGTFARSVDENGKMFVIVDNEKFGPYDRADELTFSPDGKTLAYRAEIDYDWYIVVGKDKAGSYGDVGCITFSPDGKRLAYYITTGSVINRKKYIIIGGKQYGPYDSSHYTEKMFFSPDSKSFVLEMETRDYDYYIVKDGIQSDVYDYVGNMLFSPDSKIFAYSIRYSRDKEYIFVNGKKLGPYKSIGILKFSPNSEMLIFNAEAENTWSNYLLIDGTPYIGNICGDHAVYLKNGAIWTR